MKKVSTKELLRARERERTDKFRKEFAEKFERKESFIDRLISYLFLR